MVLYKKIIIGLLIYLFFIFAIFPARVALSFMPIPEHILLSNVSGSIWQGNIETLQIDDRKLEHVRWDLSFFPLLLGKLAIDFHIGNRASEVSAKGKVDLSSSGIAFTDFRFDAPSHFILGRTQLPFRTAVEGNIDVIIPKFIQGKPWCEQLMGKVFVGNLQVNNQFGQYPLGNIELALACDKGNIQVEAKENGNKLGVKGTAELEANNIFNVNAKIKKTSTQPADLTQALTFLGKADRNGYYSITYKGTLPRF